MAVRVLDTVGLKSPNPILKIAMIYADMDKGDILEIWGIAHPLKRMSSVGAQEWESGLFA